MLMSSYSVVHYLFSLHFAHVALGGQWHLAYLSKETLIRERERAPSGGEIRSQLSLITMQKNREQRMFYFFWRLSLDKRNASTWCVVCASVTDDLLTGEAIITNGNYISFLWKCISQYPDWRYRQIIDVGWSRKICFVSLTKARKRFSFKSSRQAFKKTWWIFHIVTLTLARWLTRGRLPWLHCSLLTRHEIFKDSVLAQVSGKYPMAAN